MMDLKGAATACVLGTFAVIFIPGVNTVLDAIADEGLVDAHVAMTEERIIFTWSCKTKGKTH